MNTLNRVLDIIDGKRVAIVGNATPEQDHSEEIDNCDIVIRFNHCYNVESNKVGRKLDILAVSVTDAFLKASSDPDFNGYLKKYKPEVLVVKHPQTTNSFEAQAFFKGATLSYVGDKLRELPDLTSGTILLSLLARYAHNSEFILAGFGDDITYFEKWGAYFKEYKDIELQYRDDAIAALSTCKIIHPTNDDVTIIIPVRKGSKGTPHKNIAITADGRSRLKKCVDTCRATGLRVVVTSDSQEYLNSISSDCETVLIPHDIEDEADVTLHLRETCNMLNIHGWIAMVQVTNEDTTPEIILRAISSRKNQADIVTTLELIHNKSACIYFAENNKIIHKPSEITSSTPRQQMSSVWGENGMFFIFHSCKLRYPSYWQEAQCIPLFLDGNTQDID